MIVENLVPEVYYKESRDFAYAGRVFEVLFNYMKTAAACVNVNYNIDSTSASIIDLLADSLGFTTKHHYDIKNLVAIINSFQSLLRLKGSILAIETAIKILMNAQEILPLDTKDLCEKDLEDDFLLNIINEDVETHDDINEVIKGYQFTLNELIDTSIYLFT